MFNALFKYYRYVKLMYMWVKYKQFLCTHLVSGDSTAVESRGPSLMTTSYIYKNKKNIKNVTRCRDSRSAKSVETR